MPAAESFRELPAEALLEAHGPELTAIVRFGPAMPALDLAQLEGSSGRGEGHQRREGLSGRSHRWRSGSLPGAETAFPVTLPGGLPVAPVSAYREPSIWDRLEAMGFHLGGMDRLRYERALGRLVIGLEADGALLGQMMGDIIGISGPKRIGSATTDCGGCRPRHLTSTETGAPRRAAPLDGIQTASGRIGMPFGPVLFYLSAGLAAAEASFGAARALGDRGNGLRPLPMAGATAAAGGRGAIDRLGFGGSSTRLEYGYMAGAGLGHQLSDRLAISLEGFYYDIGRTSLVARNRHDEAVARADGRLDGVIIRAGIELRF
jgi:opacity protein-like surface antigen